MTDLRERVARAICKVTNRACDCAGTVCTITGSQADAAIAAYETLRVPQIRNDTLEEAAKVAEDTSGSMGPVIAAAIRALNGDKT